MVKSISLSCLLLLSVALVIGAEDAIPTVVVGPEVSHNAAPAATSAIPQGFAAPDQKNAMHALAESYENKMDFVKIFTGKYYQGPYKTINDHLEKTVDPNADLKTNMDAVELLLKRSKSNFIGAVFKEGLIEALEQLLALRQIMSDENKCTRRSYAILFKNDQATKGAAHKSPSELGKVTRVVYIVRQYMLRHAIECRQVYPAVYEQIRASMNEDMLNRVELFTTNLIQKKRKVMLVFDTKPTVNPGDLLTEGRTIKQVKGKDLSEATYRTIEFLAKDDENVKYLRKIPIMSEQKFKVVEEKVGDLMRDYIELPCEYYVNQMGPDVFLPAHFDEPLFEPENRYQSQEFPEFLLGSIRYRLCNSLITKDRQSLLKGLIKIANKN